MVVDQYTVEVLSSTDTELSSIAKSEALQNLVQQAGVSSDVELGNPVRRRHFEDLAVSVGTILLTNPDSLLLLLRHIKNSDKYSTGIKQASDGRIIGVNDVDKSLVVNNGGTVIGDVEGDLVFIEDGESMDLTIALNMKKVEEESEEDDERSK